MSGKLRIVELTEHDAMEYCRNEGWSLPESIQSSGDLNAYWALLGKRCWELCMAARGNWRYFF